MAFRLSWLTFVAVLASTVPMAWAGRGNFDILGVDYAQSGGVQIPGDASRAEALLAQSLSRDFASVAREARTNPESGFLDVFVTGDGYRAEEGQRFLSLAKSTA